MDMRQQQQQQVSKLRHLNSLALGQLKITYLAHQLLVARTRRVEWPLWGRVTWLISCLLVRVLGQTFPRRLIRVNIHRLLLRVFRRRVGVASGGAAAVVPGLVGLAWTVLRLRLRLRLLASGRGRDGRMVVVLDWTRGDQRDSAHKRQAGQVSAILEWLVVVMRGLKGVSSIGL